MGTTLLDVDDLARTHAVQAGDIDVRAMLVQAAQSALRRGRCPVEVFSNDYEFVHHYQPVLDGALFDWKRYPHLVEVYEDESRFQVMMCGAQSGKTARMIVLAVRRMLMHYGSMFGYYLPDYKLAEPFSQRRFTPMVRSMTAIGKLLGAMTAMQKGTNAQLTKTLGPSSLMFLSTNTKTGTEGLPLKGVFFDEVRAMGRVAIELAMERYSAQIDPYDVKVSTAGYPNSDIDYYYQKGTQHRWHCDSGRDGYVLAENWPNCVLDLRNATPQLLAKVAHAFEHDGLPLYGMTESERRQFPPAVYYNHRTGEIITDPRRGWWEAKYPDRFVRSYHLPQMLSPTYPAGRILQKHENARDPAEFTRSGIGLPFIDEDARPVKDEHLAACVDTSLVWAMTKPTSWRRAHIRNSCMGVDAQAGYLIVVAKHRLPNGKWQTNHVEVAYEGQPEHVGTDPWRRLAVLMVELDVRCCVIDWQPHWNEAVRFAQAFPGRVWLAGYGGENELTDMVAWGDQSRSRKRKGEDGRFRHTVRIHRVKGLRWSLGRWGKRLNAVPDPGRLLQDLPHQGGSPLLAAGLRGSGWQATPVARTLYMPHQKGIVFRNVYADDDARQRRGERRDVAEHIMADAGAEDVSEVAEDVGADPHFAHAELYCNVAMDRFGGG